MGSLALTIDNPTRRTSNTINMKWWILFLGLLLAVGTLTPVQGGFFDSDGDGLTDDVDDDDDNDGLKDNEDDDDDGDGIPDEDEDDDGDGLANEDDDDGDGILDADEDDDDVGLTNADDPDDDGDGILD